MEFSMGYNQQLCAMLDYEYLTINHQRFRQQKDPKNEVTMVFDDVWRNHVRNKAQWKIWTALGKFQPPSPKDMHVMRPQPLTMQKSSKITILHEFLHRQEEHVGLSENRVYSQL